MGKIVTVWSPMHRQTTTASMVALATGLNNTILTHTQKQMSQLELMLGFKKSAETKIFENTGMNGLIFATAADRVSDKDIKKAAIEIQNTGTYVLPALGQTETDDRNHYVQYLIADRLKHIYDYVFVDLPAGTSTDFDLTKKLWQAADINCVVLTDAILWEDYAIKYPELGKPLYVLGGYHPESKFNVTTFRFNISRDVVTVPYCVGYYDAISAGRVPEFLLKNKYASYETKGAIKNSRSKAIKIAKKDDTQYFFTVIKENKKWFG